MGMTPDIEAAVRVLRSGGLVAFPTETVYGLGAAARDPAAVARIFAAKGRPSDHPLIVHLPGPAHLPRWAAHVPEAAQRLVEAFWPGPLGIVLPRAEGVPDAVTGGLPSVALRMPAHAVALALLEAFGDGVAAPSANRYGRVSPTRAAHVREELGERVDLVLDGGDCEVGIESTLLDLSQDEPVLLRPGGIDVARIEAVVGRPVRSAGAGDAPAPGRKPSHYAPRARVVLAGAAEAAGQAARLADAGARAGLLSVAAPADPRLAWLEWPADAAGQARVLYLRLREADLLGLDVVVVTPPQGGRLEPALRDRLVRAAGQGDGRPDAPGQPVAG